jgi:hypothetical protein
MTATGRAAVVATAGCLDWLRSFPGEARIVAGLPGLIEDLGLVERAADGTVRSRRGLRVARRRPWRPS